MNSTEYKIKVENDITRFLNKFGITWKELKKSAHEIVLFGSRASKVNRSDSDWDILCIGSGKSIHKKNLDLIWIKKEELTSPKWLGSELAYHIAHYGLWLKGPGKWKSHVFVSNIAIKKKLKRIIRLIKSLEHHWQYLSDYHKQKYIIKLRRDFQRFEHLINKKPIPTTPMLDKSWHNNDDSGD